MDNTNSQSIEDETFHDFNVSLSDDNSAAHFASPPNENFSEATLILSL
jgi:hypothetical protein